MCVSHTDTHTHACARTQTETHTDTRMCALSSSWAFEIEESFVCVVAVFQLFLLFLPLLPPSFAAAYFISAVFGFSLFHSLWLLMMCWQKPKKSKSWKLFKSLAPLYSWTHCSASQLVLKTVSSRCRRSCGSSLVAAACTVIMYMFKHVHLINYAVRKVISAYKYTHTHTYAVRSRN